MTTLNNLRDSQIESLMQACGMAGDRRGVAICKAAISGSRRAKCSVVAMIRAAEAMAD